VKGQNVTTRRTTPPKPVPEPDPPADLSFEEILAGAKLPERMVPVVLRGDLYVEVERLDTELQAVIAVTDEDRLAGNPRARQLQQEIDGLRAEMVRYTQKFVLRARPHLGWTDLQAAHPPRPDVEADQRSGFNQDTLTEALIRLSIVTPVVTDRSWTDLMGKITDGQYDDLAKSVEDEAS
jgi:hypothetical protein